jgi:C4-dicarboxylate-binding protein DctP
MAARRVVLSSVLLLLGSLAAEAQQVSLRLTSQMPHSHHIGIALLQLKDEVEQRTNQTVAIEIFENSRLYKAGEVLGAVSSGAIEMGLIDAEQLVGKVPAIGILQQPFVFNFYAIEAAATDPDREMRPLFDKAIFDATGNRVLLWAPFGTTQFISKQLPTLTPSAIDKKKVRVAGKTQASFIEQCGGIPVIIAPTEQVAALQDGRADMVLTSVSGVSSRQLWRATDTVTRTAHASLETLVIIKESVWQRLSESQKAVINEVARKVERNLRAHIAQIEDEEYAFAREKGYTVYDLTPDQVVEWRACSAPVLEEFMQNTPEWAHQLMQAYGKLRTDPCCSNSQGGEFTRR